MSSSKQRSILSKRIRVQAAIGAMLCVGLPGVFAEAAQLEDKAPPSKIELFVRGYFSRVPGYKTGDLITKSQTLKLLEQMQKKGWKIKPSDSKSLLSKVLDDDAFLVQQFASDKGRDFLDKIRNLPGGIDRMDRIARMPKGERDVTAMIYKIPNGADWIKEMTTSKHGLRLSRNIARFDNNKDFDKLTGRIYFVDQLIPELENLVKAR